MKERPILFSAPMVRAILEGRKTQTRRVVQSVGSDDGFVLLDHGNGWWPYRSDDGERSFHTVKRNGNYYQDETPHSCPYGKYGDRLWVRETWRIGAWDENRCAFALDYCDGPRKQWIDVPDPCCDDGELFNRLWQQSTDDALAAGIKSDHNGNFKWEPGQSPCRWRPSIHMPRWASRITLEVTGVRVERLNDISGADAVAEGVKSRLPDNGIAQSEFAGLWESINGKGSWYANPWVWVIEFKMVEK